MERHGIVVDYAVLADPESLDPLTDHAIRAVALVAGRLGSTRLIDNRELCGRGASAADNTPEPGPAPEQGQAR